MDISTAIKMLKSEYPDLITVGYWDVGDGIVFNTNNPYTVRDVHIPAQFKVGNDGSVYGTNPVRSKLGSFKYIKL